MICPLKVSKHNIMYNNLQNKPNIQKCPFLFSYLMQYQTVDLNSHNNMAVFVTFM